METNVNYFGLFSAVEYTIKGAEGDRVNSDGYKVDKNGKLPIMLTLLSGECPVAHSSHKGQLLSGTIAERLKIEPGKTFFLSITSEPDEEYGATFQYSVLASNMSPLDIINTQKELGTPRVINVVTPKASTASTDASKVFASVLTGN